MKTDSRIRRGSPKLRAIASVEDPSVIDGFSSTLAATIRRSLWFEPS